MSEPEKVSLVLGVALAASLTVIIGCGIWFGNYRDCQRGTCSAGFPAYSYGPDRVNPISGKSIGRGSDSACYCVVIAAEEPK